MCRHPIPIPLFSVLRSAPTSAQNSVANQTNPQMEQDCADPSPRPPLQKGVWVAKEEELQLKTPILQRETAGEVQRTKNRELRTKRLEKRNKENLN